MMIEARHQQGYRITASRHRLGPLHVPLEAKCGGHHAVAIPIVAVGGLVSAGAGKQCAQSQQPITTPFGSDAT